MQRASLVALLALAACGNASAPTPSAPPPPPPTPPPPAVPVLEGAWLEPLAGGTPTLVVSTSAVTLEGATLARMEAGRIAAADVRGGESGYLVPAILDALQARAEDGSALTLMIDPATPYRTVARVVYSAGQANRTQLTFVVQQGGERGGVPIVLPTFEATRARAVQQIDQSAVDALMQGALAELGEHPTPHDSASTPQPLPEPTAEPAREIEAALDVSMTLRADGMLVVGTGGTLEPGCARTRPERDGPPSVPMSSARLDWPAATLCLGRVHDAFPDTRAATVIATDDIRFDELIRLVALARGTREQPLFPGIALGVQ